MRFYTTVKLGPNREITPAGFTLFKNVSIARTGVMIYGPGETDIDPGPDGRVYVTRTPEEAFRSETLSSFNGAPFVIDHPIDDVDPNNWQELANGFFVDVRRGSGDQKDEMVGDLLVTTAHALAEIDSGTGEISAGYDAEYRKIGEGRGEQFNIIGNHVALVEKGRCGSRCTIRDKATSDARRRPQTRTADEELGTVARYERAMYREDEESQTCTCAEQGKQCDCNKDEQTPRQRKPGESFGIRQTGDGLTPIQRFQAASDHRNGIRRPTNDELARMSPEQQFTAWSNFRNGLR
jgi:hypothetical protein